MNPTEKNQPQDEEVLKNQEAAEKSDLTANPVKAVRFSMNVQYPKRNEFFQKQKGFYHDKVYIIKDQKYVYILYIISYRNTN